MPSNQTEELIKSTRKNRVHFGLANDLCELMKPFLDSQNYHYYLILANVTYNFSLKYLHHSQQIS